MSTTLKVDGMTCAHCTAAVKKALEQVPGVETAQVSLEKAQAVVTGDAELRAMVAAIKEEGYGAEAQ